MPLTGQRKTDYQRVYMRERRAKAKAARNAPLPPVPASDWFSERLPVLPWQRDWLSGVLSDDVVYGAVSVARANGKSTWTGCIRTACVARDGPLSIPERILQRDNHQCQYQNFGWLPPLEVHHRDDDRTNNDETNLVTWCRRHHIAHHKRRLTPAEAKWRRLIDELITR